MSKTITILFSCIIALVLLGCTAQYAYPPDLSSFYTTQKFSGPFNRELVVQTGNTLLVEGTFIQGETIAIDQPLDLMIPGGIFIPFPLRIEQGSLKLVNIDNNWKYYSAAPGRFAASFPGIGSVIKEGDTAGIRISIDGRKKEWFVDNSNHNQSKTIWSKSLNRKEKQQYIPQKSNSPFKPIDIKILTFDGYFGGQLHFTWEEIDLRGSEHRTFTFDLKEANTVIGIRGYHFIAVSADNTKLVYKWLPESPAFQ